MSESPAIEKTPKLLQFQALFDPFNRGGSVLNIKGGPHDKPFTLGLIDSCLVTRVQDDNFWLHFKEVGYHDGFHHSHTIKVMAWLQDDTWLLHLVDDPGRQFHIELLFPEQDVVRYADWRRWRRYKPRRKKLFQTIDEEILESHIETAESWP